jgi:RNA polymerase sigma-70 factor (ECF subfamily)
VKEGFPGMDKQAFQQLFTDFVLEHKENVYRLAYSYVRHQHNALDIVQDAIQKAWQKSHTLSNPDSIKSWFYRIVVNTSLDFLRKEKKLQLVSNEELDEYKIAAFDSTCALDLERALEALPQPLGEVIVLRFFEDLKLEEIAAILDVPLSTVKSRLYKGLKALRNLMSEGVENG